MSTSDNMQGAAELTSGVRVAPEAKPEAVPMREGAAKVVPAGAGADVSYARIARRYLIAAAGCAAFALIYAQFSHGVYSPFMTFMFAIPLLGGAAVALAFHAAKLGPASRVSRQAWALCLASLTVASCLRGVFEIAGTDSPYLPVYLAIAAAFALVAVVSFVRGRS